MRIAFMQPYFLPYLGYFDLICTSDLLVIFDEAQYVKQRWMNRNRILHPDHGWQYITVPVKKSPLSTSIAKIQIQNSTNWKSRILNQLDHYRLRAPNFQAVDSLLRECFALNFSGLSELNVYTLSALCRFLQLDFSFEIVSDLDIDSSNFESPNDWVFDLCQRKGADQYVNLPGGVSIYDKEQFEQRGITLEFRNLPPLRYECAGYQFEPDLSIVDVLMWNSPERVREYLKQDKLAQLEISSET